MTADLALNLIAVETDLELTLEDLENGVCERRDTSMAMRMLRDRLEAVNGREIRGKDEIEANLRDLRVARRVLHELPVDTTALEAQIDRCIGLWEREYAG